MYYHTDDQTDNDLSARPVGVGCRGYAHIDVLTPPPKIRIYPDLSTLKFARIRIYADLVRKYSYAFGNKKDPTPNGSCDFTRGVRPLVRAHVRWSSGEKTGKKKVRLFFFFFFFFIFFSRRSPPLTRNIYQYQG